MFIYLKMFNWKKQVKVYKLVLAGTAIKYLGLELF